MLGLQKRLLIVAVTDLQFYYVKTDPKQDEKHIKSTENAIVFKLQVILNSENMKVTAILL